MSYPLSMPRKKEKEHWFILQHVSHDLRKKSLEKILTLI